MNYKKLTISLLLPQIAGYAGSLFSTIAIPFWYADLQKPFFNPPNWIFAPVWLILYLLMGISSYLIWQKASENKKARNATILFWVHLFFNATWPMVFFGLENPWLAMMNIAVLWLLIVILIFKFWGINKWASILLIPYLCWVSFASVLNYFFWYLNK